MSCRLLACVTKEQVQSLIISKAAVPLPPDYCDVIDCMEWWGRNVNCNWEQRTLASFKEWLDPSNGYDKSPERKELFFYVIIELVKIKLDYQYNWSEFKGQVMEQWMDEYKEWYKETNEFFTLSVRTIHYINDKMETNQTVLPALPVPLSPVSSTTIVTVKTEDS